MKRLRSFITEAESAPKITRLSDDLVTTFGRHNPPHLGHQKTFDYAHKLAGEIGDKDPATRRFYTSRSQDPKKNPLPYEIKLDHLRRMFPKYKDYFDEDPNIRTVLDTAKKAHGEGYKNFHFVGGGDRQKAMEDLLRKYNGNLYDFQNIYSHSAGARDEEADPDDPISQLSASKMRGHAMKGDFEKFLLGSSPGKHYSKEDARELFDHLRTFMRSQKSEEWEVNYRDNSELIREKYKEGKLFRNGDLIESLSNGLTGHIHRCGANHLICVTEDGTMWKSFIQDLNVINKEK